MRSVVLIVIVMLGAISCDSWAKPRKAAILEPETKQIRVSTGNDIKNKTLRLEIVIESKEQNGLATVAIFKNSRQALAYSVSFAKSLAKASIIEVCMLDGVPVLNSKTDQAKYLNVVQSTKVTSSDGTVVYSVYLERYYGVKDVKCGELSIPEEKKKYQNAIAALIPYSKSTAAKKYNVTYDFSSGAMIRFGLMAMLVLLNSYLF